MAFRFTTLRLLLTTLWGAVSVAAYSSALKYETPFDIPVPLESVLIVAPAALVGTIAGRMWMGIALGLLFALVAGLLRLVD